MDRSPELSPSVFLVVHDRSTPAVELYGSDGSQATVRLGRPALGPDSRIFRLFHAPTRNLIAMETAHGDLVTAEPPSTHHLAPTAGRPIVYLDQKDWRTLAKSVHEPRRILDRSERDAAIALVELAERKKIILPFSAGHLTETGRWMKADARYRLALTIARLSAGWQMRDPLDVRRFEIRTAFTRRFKRACLLPEAVFTLEPDVVFGRTRSTPRYVAPKDFPAEVALATASLVSLAAHFDSVLDAEPVAMTDVPGWTERQRQFTAWLAGGELDAKQKRRAAEAFFIADTKTEIADEAQRAGISADDLTAWFTDYRVIDVGAMPSLGLFREVLHGKLVNQSTTWEADDLTDLMYLACASGYADHVVGERATVGRLAHAMRRLGRPVNVHRRLQDLVPVLRG